jgi:hypothetical protein
MASPRIGALMAAGYKVKISDGSVVGPLDDDMVRSWYEQGLIDQNTPVLPPGARRWVRLRDVVDMSESEREEVHEKKAPRAPVRGGRVVAGAVLIASAAGATAALLAPPGTWRGDLQPVPWLEIGLGMLFLGLAALHESDWARKLARTGVALAAFALCPIAGLVIAKGVPLEALAVLGCAMLAAAGLFFLLAPALPLTRLAAAILVVLGGAYGIFRFGVVMGATAVAATGASGLFAFW